MSTISLSTTTALYDLMPRLGGRRKVPDPVASVAVAPPLSSEAAPLHLRLLPRAWRVAMMHRIRQRELETAFERLVETSPHLLADIGLRTDAEAAALARNPAERRPAAGLPRRDDHLVQHIGPPRARMMQTARIPVWDAPDHWLRHGY